MTNENVKKSFPQFLQMKKTEPLTNHEGMNARNKLRSTGIEMNSIAFTLGMTRQNLYYHLRKDKLETDFIKKLELNFPSYFTKESKMENRPVIEAKPLFVASDPNDYDNDGSKFEHLDDGLIRMRIPLVPYKAYAGYLRGFQDTEFYEDLRTVSIDVEKEHRGDYIAFEVSGDSMVPELKPENQELIKQAIWPGWVVVGRFLPKKQWQYKLHTHYVDAWIIVHAEDGILIKNISKHDVENGIITIHSLNPNYKDKDLKLADIEQIFSVVRRLPEY